MPAARKIIDIVDTSFQSKGSSADCIFDVNRPKEEKPKYDKIYYLGITKGDTYESIFNKIIDKIIQSDAEIILLKEKIEKLENDSKK